MKTTLNLIRPGESCVVIHVEGEGVVRRRLFDMGITPGVAIKVSKIAPLGDPMQMELRGYQLSLRGEEAAPVVVEALERAEVVYSGCNGSCAHCGKHSADLARK